MSYPDYLDIARGIEAKLSVGDKFGRNSSVGASFVPVCNGGIYRTPKVAVPLRVSAGNENDSASGTGARSITLIGLDSNGNEITETIETNGLSAGEFSSQSFLRLYRCYVETCGTYADQNTHSHAGDISIDDGTNTWAIIRDTEIGRGQSQIGVLTIPKGYRMFLTASVVSVDSAKVANILLFQRQNILQVTAPFSSTRVVEEFTGVSGVQSHQHNPPIGPFPELTDFGFMARVGTQTADVSIAFDYIMEKVD